MLKSSRQYEHKFNKPYPQWISLCFYTTAESNWGEQTLQYNRLVSTLTQDSPKPWQMLEERHMAKTPAEVSLGLYSLLVQTHTHQNALQALISAQSKLIAIAFFYSGVFKLYHHSFGNYAPGLFLGDWIIFLCWILTKPQYTINNNVNHCIRILNILTYLEVPF